MNAPSAQAELVEASSFSLENKNGASTGSAQTVLS